VGIDPIAERQVNSANDLPRGTRAAPFRNQRRRIEVCADADDDVRAFVVLDLS
jgi:hypothetical protein